jgi:hypothetical protein
LWLVTIQVTAQIKRIAQQTKDNTNMYDTGVGSSMTDTAQHRDTSLIPNKMQDTGTKK